MCSGVAALRGWRRRVKRLSRPSSQRPRDRHLARNGFHRCALWALELVLPGRWGRLWPAWGWGGRLQVALLSPLSLLSRMLFTLSSVTGRPQSPVTGLLPGQVVSNALDSSRIKYQPAFSTFHLPLTVSLHKAVFSPLFC